MNDEEKTLMGSFGMAIDIIKADIKHFKKGKALESNEHNIERARIVLDSLRVGKKLENK